MARILVVDDKEQDRYMLKILLEKCGYDIVAAGNGEQALATARQTPPDMIVSDILMPVMDGFTLCREWKKSTELRTIPFVFYTATYTEPRDEEFAINLGADRFIVKPVDPERLLNELNDALAQGVREKTPDTDYTEESTEDYFKMYSEVLVHKLEDKLELFSAIFNTDPGIILVFSESRTVSEINRSAQDLLGVRAEEVLDKPFPEALIGEKYRNAFFEQCSSVFDGQSIHNFECDMVSRDGAVYNVVWNGERLMRSSGAVEGALLIGANITAQRAAERERKVLERELNQAQKMEVLGTFASGIAHDFNNILTAIVGHLDLALHIVGKDSEAAEDLKDALAASDRARNLSSQILAFTRRGKEQREPVDVVRVVEEAVKLIRAVIPTTIDIEKQTQKHCGMVEGFSTEIHQIVMNLCTNAFHAIGKGPGKITIACFHKTLSGDEERITPSLPDGHYLVIEIQDTGCGMNKEIMGRIFDPYFTTKKEGKGTGLGLPVVRGIVEMHNGGMSVESEPGHGSTFRVYLPRMIPVSEKTEMHMHEDVRGGTERILLVEDEESNRELFTIMLEGMGYTVQSASDGVEAIDLFTKTPDDFDCVITDLTMPRMGGGELAREIRAIKKTHPIVIMSGSDVYGEDPGIEGDIVIAAKPMMMHELAKAVREAIDAKSKRHF